MCHISFYSRPLTFKNNMSKPSRILKCWEVEVAVSQDRATALQQSETLSLKKKKE